MTRLAPPWRLRAPDAQQLLKRTFRGRATLAGLDGTEAWTMLGALADGDVASGATYDAHVAACARKTGARVLATFDHRHFERVILADQLGARRLRRNPRVIKRKMSNWPVKRNKHRAWPQATIAPDDQIQIKRP